MSVGRIKTLSIAILLFINVFFLAVIIRDTVADARSERQAMADVCAILSAGGISLDPDNIRGAGPIKMMRTARSLESEAVIARAVLGDAEVTEGAIYRYESEGRGTAEFSSAGNFEIQLDAGTFTDSGNPVKAVKNLLRSMKIDTSEIEMTEDSTVVAVCSYSGVSIFNCTIEFLFNGENLETITGKNVTGIEAADNARSISTPGTVLLGFLASVKKGDAECTRISYVEAGYQHHAAGSFGEGFISPAWLISTDTGRYIVDDATGEILSRQTGD